MKKKHLLLLAPLLVAVCALVLILCGRTYTVRLNRERLRNEIPSDPSAFTVDVQNPDVARCETIRVEDETLLLTFHGGKPGKTHVEVSLNGALQNIFNLHVHPFGVITFDSFFGDCTGAAVIPAGLLLFLAAVLWVLIRQHRVAMRISLYQYRNVMRLGLIVFVCFQILLLIPQLIGGGGVLRAVEMTVQTTRLFAIAALPAAFVLSILITISNVTLMRREGRTWRNMLGTILGVGLCLLTLLPEALGEFLQRTTLVDVHNESGLALYVELFTEGFVTSLAVYLECMLLGTVSLSLKAARRVPPPDRDYMLILGCQIMDDGSLTPLLKSRADRALAFAEMQKEKTGKDLTFVPSGGRGPDEVMAEADAIKNYLLSVGVPDARILPENRSVNTEENIRNSMRLIREAAGETQPKVAFSTTNYHVFRAGLIAFKQGERLEGVGSPTKRYFWINAFVREFVATLVSERRTHLLMIAVLSLMLLATVAIRYLSVIL